MLKALTITVTSLLFFAALPDSIGADWSDQLNLPEAEHFSQGSDVTVGLVDTGVADDPDLSGAVIARADFPDMGVPVDDAIGHGTTMALLIAGRGTHGATKGVAPLARIASARIAGGSDEANAAIRWAVDQGARILNISLGSRGSDSAAYDAGLSYAHDHDVLVVAAAGNSSQDHGVTSPANRPGVLAVSAVDRAGRFDASVSVSGPEVALAAPGVEISTSRPGEKGPTSGTSQAAALVSGVAALVRSRFPQLTADQVAHQLERTAKDLGPKGRDQYYGFGLVDPVRALKTPPASPALTGDAGNHWFIYTAAAALVLLTAGAYFALRKIRR